MAPDPQGSLAVAPATSGEGIAEVSHVEPSDRMDHRVQRSVDRDLDGTRNFDRIFELPISELFSEPIF